MRYLSWDMKNTFSIFIEQVFSAIFAFIYSLATISASLETLVLAGSKKTMFFDNWIALFMILSRGGVKDELLRQFYY